MLKNVVARLFRMPAPTETLYTAIPASFWEDGWIKMEDIQQSFKYRKGSAHISPAFSRNFSTMTDAAIGGLIQKRKLPFFAPDKYKILPAHVYVSGQSAIELIKGSGRSTAAVIGHLKKYNTDKDLEQVYRCALQGMADLIEQNKFKTTQELEDDNTIVDCRQSGAYHLTIQTFGSSVMFILKRNSPDGNQIEHTDEKALKPPF